MRLEGASAEVNNVLGARCVDSLVPLRALESIGRTRSLDDETIAKRETFRRLLDLAGVAADR